MSKRAMGPMVIVIVTPRADDRLRVRDRFEAIHVETLVPETPVETLDKRVLHRLSGPDEIQGDPALVGPFVQRLRRKFGPVIDGDRFRQRATRRQRLERSDDALAGQGDVGLHQHTLATPLIDDGQYPKRPAGDELVVHEVHAPRLIAAARRYGATMQTEPLLAARAHPHLQPLEAVQAMNPLLVIRPSFTAQHDPDAHVAEPWPRLRELANPHPQGRRVTGPRFVVLGVRTDAGERTRAPTAHLI